MATQHRGLNKHRCVDFQTQHRFVQSQNRCSNLLFPIKHRFFTTLRVLLCFSAVRGVLKPQPFCRKVKQREGSGVAGKHRCTVRVLVAPAYHRAARSGAAAGLLPVCSSPGPVMCAGVRSPFHSMGCQRNMSCVSLAVTDGWC